MSLPESPERWTDCSELPSEVREVMRRARDDGATSGDMDRLRAKLLPPPTSPPQGGSDGGASASGITTGAAKAAVAGAVSVALVGGAVALGGWWKGKEVPAEVTSAPRVPAPIESVSAEELPAKPMVSAEAASSESSGAPAVAPARASTRLPAADRESEASLLEAARRALPSRPDQTLALARRHRQLYPAGMLAQERDVLEVKALKKLGRDKEADDRATQFRTDHPGSVHGNALGTAGSSGP